MSPSKETVFIHRSHPTRPMLHHLRQQACHLITSVPRCFCWFILPPPSIVAKHIDYGNFSSILPSDLRSNLLNNVCNPSQGHIKSSGVMQIQTPGRNRRPLVHLQWLISNQLLSDGCFPAVPINSLSQITILPCWSDKVDFLLQGLLSLAQLGIRRVLQLHAPSPRASKGPLSSCSTQDKYLWWADLPLIGTTIPIITGTTVTSASFGC